MDAIIFDMDGVIVNSEIHWKSIEHEFLASLIADWSAEDQKSILGMSAYDVHKLLVERRGLTLSRDEFVGYYHSLATEIYSSRADVFPGVVGAIERLAAKLPCAIASASPKNWIETVIKRLEIGAWISVYLGGDDFIGRGKPYPDIYLEAAKRLNVAPERCVAIEDTAKGIKAAKSAGMVCLGYKNGFNEERNLSEADAVVDDFESLTLARVRDFWISAQGSPQKK